MRVQITSLGKRFLLIVIVMLMAAINYNNSLAYLLIFLLLGLFILGFIKGWLNIFHLSLRSININNIFANQNLSIKAKISSDYSLQSQFVEVSVLVTNGISSASIIEVTEPEIFDLEVTSLSRGICHIEKIVLTSTYPLGLFRWKKVVDVTEYRAWIYPKPINHELTPIAQSPDKFIEVGDFDELVNWQEGDGLSGICWKTFAKTGNRMKKNFAQQHGDQSNTFDWSDSNIDKLSDEQKLSQLCFWIKERNISGQLFGLKLPKASFSPASGVEHYQKCLKALATFNSGVSNGYNHV